MPILISISGILSIILAAKVKTKKNNTYIIIFDILSLCYLIAISWFLWRIVPTIVDLRLALTYPFVFLGEILYAISIIISKRREPKLNNDSPGKVFLSMIVIMLLIPVASYLLVFYREIFLIKNSDVIIAYHNSGNGGLDSTDVVYVISDNYRDLISLNVEDIYWNYNRFLLPRNLKVVNKSKIHSNKIDINVTKKQSDGYNDIIGIKIYKNNKLIYDHEDYVDDFYNIYYIDR